MIKRLLKRAFSSRRLGRKEHAAFFTNGMLERGVLASIPPTSTGPIRLIHGWNLVANTDRSTVKVGLVAIHNGTTHTRFLNIEGRKNFSHVRVEAEISSTAYPLHDAIRFMRFDAHSRTDPGSLTAEIVSRARGKLEGQYVLREHIEPGEGLSECLLPIDHQRMREFYAKHAGKDRKLLLSFSLTSPTFNLAIGEVGFVTSSEARL